MEITRESLIHLTTRLYQITILFPKKEPLRYKMREIANDILNGFIKIDNLRKRAVDAFDIIDQVCDGLDVMDGFFAISKEQNWVAPDELLPIWEGYSGMKEFLQDGLKDKNVVNDISLIGDIVNNVSLVSNGELSQALGGQVKKSLNDRQQKILETIKEKGKVQVGEFKDVFPMVTKRTLRRDFWQLFQSGEVERVGEKNDTYYQLISRT